jgi:hypothetical protein
MLVVTAHSFGFEACAWVPRKVDDDSGKANCIPIYQKMYTPCLLRWNDAIQKVSLILI